MKNIIFRGVPLPPSSNHQYRSFSRNGKIMHVPSIELLQFRKAFDYYCATEATNIKFAREFLIGKPLHVDCIFYFEKSRILSKKLLPKQLDVSNRLKALHDALAKALLIDDCHFFRISAEKQIVPDKRQEGVTVFIEPCDIIEILSQETNLKCH